MLTIHQQPSTKMKTFLFCITHKYNKTDSQCYGWRPWKITVASWDPKDEREVGAKTRSWCFSIATQVTRVYILCAHHFVPATEIKERSRMRDFLHLAEIQLNRLFVQADSSGIWPTRPILRNKDDGFVICNWNWSSFGLRSPSFCILRLKTIEKAGVSLSVSSNISLVSVQTQCIPG